jgi:hypothetical protein
MRRPEMLPSILHGCHFDTISSFSTNNFDPDIFYHTLYFEVFFISMPCSAYTTYFQKKAISSVRHVVLRSMRTVSPQNSVQKILQLQYWVTTVPFVHVRNVNDTHRLLGEPQNSEGFQLLTPPVF